MKKIKTLLIFQLVLISFLFISSCSTDKIKLGYYKYKAPDPAKIISTKNQGYIPANQILIILKEGYGKNEAEKIASSINGKIVGEMEYMNLFQIENNNSTENELISQLEKILKTEGVENAFSNCSVYLYGSENAECNPLEDSVYSGINSKPYDMIGLKNAWDIIKMSKIKLNTVKVGVNDSKLGTKSNEITGETMIAGNDAEDLDNNTGNTHANNVVNIIGANSKNGGVSGVASILGKNLNINVIATCNEKPELTETEEDITDITKIKYGDGKTYIMQTLVDLQRQIESGSKVINCSFGFGNVNLYYSSKGVKRFLEKMYKEHPDVIFVGAAGNSNEDISSIPNMWGHDLPNLITVGSLNHEGQPSSYTNYSGSLAEVTISACGTNIHENGQVTGGTSFAAPQVSGVIAIMKSINPDLSASEIKKILVETASKTVNGKEIQIKDPQNRGGKLSPCLRADEAILRVINDLRKKNGEPELKLEDLVNLGNVNLTSSGGPEEFTVTATINKTTPEGGTTLEIYISGGTFNMSDEKVKTLNSPGSVTWVIKKPDLETVLHVKVKRFDTDNCKVVLLKSVVNAKTLLGKWDGEIIPVNWSSSNDLIRQYSASTMDAIMGVPKPLTLFMEYVDENNVLITLKVEGGKVIPQKKFTFTKNKLHSEFYFDMHNYTYDAEIKEETDKITLKGKWKTVTYNNTVTMNGTWTASKKKGE